MLPLSLRPRSLLVDDVSRLVRLGMPSPAVAEMPCIMLVRMEPDEEPAELAEHEGAIQLLRTRHPLPAVQRIRITRPSVVLIGAKVRGADSVLLAEAARGISAAVLQMGPLVAREALGDWIRAALQIANERLALARASRPPAAAE
jgi:hypothetical protein